MDLVLMDAEIRRDEGVRYTLYYDTLGIPSTGVGHNLRASPLPAGWTYPLTDAQVDQLLNGDLQTTFSGLDANIPWWRGLDEVRQRVITNMAFNMGVSGLMTFHNMLGALQSGSYAVAASDMQASTWYRQVEQRAVRLCEAMETGVMPDEPAAV
jgi:lysozyme